MAILAFLIILFMCWLMYESFSCLTWIMGIVILACLLSLVINYIWLWLPIVIIIVIIAAINEYRSRKK